MKPTKQFAAPKPRPVDAGLLSRLIDTIPMRDAATVPQPIDFAEFRKRHG